MDARTARFALALAALVALSPAQVRASSWGSGYGDPPAFCPNHSGLPGSYGVDVTNDPLVGNNPEQDTFYGFHPNPGYDDWYGFFYGDFRGTPGDSSGWTYLTRDSYPTHSHWNFADFGWSVHGHVKQYVAYYNWTFGGECGMGVYGSSGPPPYMADQYGTPVLDIYVDSTPPDSPQPRVAAVDTTSVAFTWKSVIDRGDGAGADYFAVGLDHYSSWLTVDGGPPSQLSNTAQPRTLVAGGLAAGHTACVHVRAADLLGNTTPDSTLCSQPAGPPPAPPAPAPPGAVAVNPQPTGLVGFESWFWIQPTPRQVTTEETYNGINYRVVATPSGVAWSFGDGAGIESDSGQAYPAQSRVRHTYEGWSADGFAVAATIHYDLNWWLWSGARWEGPYPMTGQDAAAAGLAYPVQQAQPQLTKV